MPVTYGPGTTPVVSITQLRETVVTEFATVWVSAAETSTAAAEPTGGYGGESGYES